MRYLCLDLGDRYIGVAVSDMLGMLARPLEVFKRTSRVADFAHIATLTHKHNVTALVVGLPIQMDGSEGTQAAWVRNYSSALGEAVDLAVNLWDERLTTIEAEAIMRKQGKRPTKAWIDAVAAAVILQSFLDAQSEQLRTEN